MLLGGTALYAFATSAFGYRSGDFPHAERLADTCLALPFAGTMTEAAVDRVCATLRASLRG